MDGGRGVMRRDDLAAGGGPVLLLTRPKDRAAEFADAVQARLARPVPVLVSPLVEIVPLGVTPDIARDAVLLFTSAAGPASLGPHYEAAGRWAYCVGDRTADAARAAGFRARSADGDAAALARLVREAAPVAPLVHVRGAHAKGDLAGRLSAAGFQVSECVTYRQQECPPAPELVRLLSGACDVVAPVFSPRGSARLAAATEGRQARLHVVAISGAAASAFGAPADRIDVAASPTGRAMLAAVIRALGASRLVDTGAAG